MNLEQVSHYVTHPHELGLAEAASLKSLSEKHPYAAVFSLLYLTALSNGKSIDLDTALQQHAYRLSDRTQLYQLLNNREGLPVNEPVELTEEMVVESPVVDSIQPIAPIIEMPVETSSIEVTHEEVVDQEEETEITLDFTEEEASISPIVALEEFETITDAFTREQAFDLNQTEPISEENQSEEIHTEEQTKEIQPIEIADEPLVAFIKPQEKFVEADQKLEDGEKRSFTSWLKSSATEKVNPSPQEFEKKKVDEIIEEFIKEEPSITRAKTDFFSPYKKAKESLDENAVPISETLAKIYAAQGNYPKAIHVYHQLMLSFPEKKSLFAVQIDTLKKKITP